jgi:hypothetical protein
MHILNITFSVDPSVEEGFVSAVQQQIIPKLDHKSSLLPIRHLDFKSSLIPQQQSAILNAPHWTASTNNYKLHFPISG